MNVLLIDDDTSLRRSLRLALETLDHRVTEADCGDRAKQLLSHTVFDVAFLDLRLGTEQGLDLLPELLQLAPGLDVIVVTAYATIETAVEAMRRGAFDYLPKPFTPEQLRLVLDRSRRMHRLQTQVEDLEAAGSRGRARGRSEDGGSRDAAGARHGGESRGQRGHGAIARRKRNRQRSSGAGDPCPQPRAAGPFVTVHCPSLSAELLESELFGHARGSFTGAVQDTLGKVAAAEGGTLFLDEIGELPLALQPKLLRLLQEKRYERVGETQTRVCDVRLLAATNRDLNAAVAAGTFREDLLYRLNVIEIDLPPLRQRRADIPVLANHLLRLFSRQSVKPATGFTPEALAAIERYRWPGNVRELRNAIERGVILASADWSAWPICRPKSAHPPPARWSKSAAGLTLDALEAEHIRRILMSTETMEEAAAVLGIDPSTLYRKRKRYGL